ncbi:MAG: amidohydrolase family protein [Phycisphaerae bacterium]|nr:amidohydrolase family protein [Phycisphaerae bacterium]
MACPLLALVLASAAVAQPLSTSPLIPPANGVRRVDPSWHALVNATVHVGPGESRERATVVIRDGVISSVEGEGARLPVGARVWDCTGLHVYAGFIDAYVEVEAPTPDRAQVRAHWNAKVTPQRLAADGALVDARTAEALRGMGFAAAGASPRGGVFRGQGAVVSLGRAPEASSEGRPPIYASPVFHAVSFELSRGERGSADAEAYWSSYPNSQMGAIALVRQTLHDAGWQASARAGGAFHDPPNALDALAGGLPLLFDTEDELEATRVAKLAREFQRGAIVLGCGTEYQRLDAIRADGLAFIVPLSFPRAPDVSSLGKAESTDLRTLMAWEQAPGNPRYLDGAGVKVALTTSKLRERKEFWGNLRTAVRAGLAEDRALAMLTTTPADLLGVSRMLGTVEAGKRANLLVTDGPVFAAKTKKRDVWIDGVRHELSPAPSEDPVGTWRVAEANGAAVEEATAPRVYITRDGGVTVAVGERQSKASRVTIAGRKVDYTYENKALVEKDAPSGVVTDSFVAHHDGAMGVSIMPDGSVHRLRLSRTSKDATPPKPGPRPAARVEPVGDQPGAPAPEAAPQPEAGPDAWAEEKKDDKEEEKIEIPALPGYPFGPYALRALPEQPEWLAITNATIWTCNQRNEVIEGGTLLVRRGKIEAVGAGVSVPEGAVVVDAAGRHVAPGIIDCHSHTGISRGVNESGQAVTAEVRIQDVTDPDAISWYRQLAGGVTAVGSLHGSANPIGGQNAVNRIRWGVAHPEEMHFAGRDSYSDANPWLDPGPGASGTPGVVPASTKVLGANKVMPGIKFALGENVKSSNSGSSATTRYPQTRMGVETIIRDRFTAAREYAGSWREWSLSKAGLPPRRDLELEALAEILEHRRLVHCHSYRQDEILMLSRVAAEFGFRIGTYQHILEGYKVADAVRDSSIGASAFSDWWAYKVEVQDAIPEGPTLMHEVGVTVSYNSDSDELARRLNVEAGKAVKYGGLSPAVALRFVTINPARQLAIDDRVGSIEPEKDADFAIWSGPPTSSTSRCEATYVEGRRSFSLEDDAAHRRTIQSERQRLIQKALAHKPARGESSGPPAGAPADEPRAALEAYFMDLLRSGRDPLSARPGDCGCGFDASLLFGR